jgi:hypothetical protein
VEELINRLISSDLKDLEGLKITGTIPVTERLVNEIAAEYLRDFFDRDDEPEKVDDDDEDRPDYARLVSLLRLHQFNVRFEPGRMVLNIDVGR